MNLGNKILELRKKNHLSQEELAEQIGVTRQTISKWELEETAPDIKQAKELSKFFQVSLDELVNNDVNNIVVEKVSNTERLAEIIIKILKIFGILFVVFLLLGILGIVLFGVTRWEKEGSSTVIGEYSMTCVLGEEEYSYEIQFNENFQVLYSGGDAFISNHVDLIKYEDANQMKAHIEDYFEEHGGSCKTIEENS